MKSKVFLASAPNSPLEQFAIPTCTICHFLINSYKYRILVHIYKQVRDNIQNFCNVTLSIGTSLDDKLLASNMDMILLIYRCDLDSGITNFTINKRTQGVPTCKL